MTSPSPPSAFTKALFYTTPKDSDPTSSTNKVKESDTKYSFVESKSSDEKTHTTSTTTISTVHTHTTTTIRTVVETVVKIQHG